MKILLKISFLFLCFIVFSNVDASAQTAVLNNTPGCPFQDGAGYARCFDCWSCSGVQKCYGDCGTSCGTCYSVFDVPGQAYDLLELYYPNGTVKHSYHINTNWVINNISIDNKPGTEILFTIYVEN